MTHVVLRRPSALSLPAPDGGAQDDATPWRLVPLTRETDLRPVAEAMHAAYRGTPDDEDRPVAGLISAFEPLTDKEAADTESTGTTPQMTVSGAEAEEEPFVAVVFTHPDHQGEGLATGMLRAMLEAAAGAGYRTAHLWVDEDNDPAAHLYRDLGFTEVELGATAC